MSESFFLAGPPSEADVFRGRATIPKRRRLSRSRSRLPIETEKFSSHTRPKKGAPCRTRAGCPVGEPGPQRIILGEGYVAPLIYPGRSSGRRRDVLASECTIGTRMTLHTCSCILQKSPLAAHARLKQRAIIGPPRSQIRSSTPPPTHLPARSADFPKVSTTPRSDKHLILSISLSHRFESFRKRSIVVLQTLNLILTQRSQL